MNEFNVEEYRKFLKKCGISVTGFPVRASLTYLPYGYSIREKLYGIGVELLKEKGFKQIQLSDLIDIESIQKIDSVSSILGNYFHIENTDFCMTAGHEASFYALARELLKDHSRRNEFPMKYFNFGAVYRMPKNTRFPFNYGERKCFLECYTLHKTHEEAVMELNEGIEWNKAIVQDILHLPSVEVERPRATNKQFSHKSIHIDTITPLGETIITGMTYFHDDVFTKALNVKRRDDMTGKNHYVYSTHFGLSENVLHSYLINCYDGTKFTFYSFLAPIQIFVMDVTNKNIAHDDEFESTMNVIRNYDCECVATSPKEISKLVKANQERGVPIIIILKSNNGNTEVKFLSCGEEFIISSDKLKSTIEEYFSKNDANIANRFKKIEEEAIIYCNSIENIINTVANSKIAKFYCNKDDEKVAKIESKLYGGEVLGFSEVEEEGLDIIDNTRTTWVAYASRRS